MVMTKLVLGLGIATNHNGCDLKVTQVTENLRDLKKRFLGMTSCFMEPTEVQRLHACMLPPHFRFFGEFPILIVTTHSPLNVNYDVLTPSSKEIKA